MSYALVFYLFHQQLTHRQDTAFQTLETLIREDGLSDRSRIRRVACCWVSSSPRVTHFCSDVASPLDDDPSLRANIFRHPITTNQNLLSRFTVFLIRLHPVTLFETGIKGSYDLDSPHHLSLTHAYTNLDRRDKDELTQVFDRGRTLNAIQSTINIGTFGPQVSHGRRSNAWNALLPSFTRKRSFQE